MKRMIYQMNYSGRRRLEVRDPVIRELSPRPNSPSVRMRHHAALSAHRFSSYADFQVETQEVVFEYVKMISRYWNQEYLVDEDPDDVHECGHYCDYVDYFLVPNGATITVSEEENDNLRNEIRRLREMIYSSSTPRENKKVDDEVPKEVEYINNNLFELE